MKLYLCRKCDHEWYDNNTKCDWCGSDAYYIGDYNDPLTISDEERLNPLSGEIYKYKNLLNMENNENNEKSTATKYTYRRRCN